MLKVMTLNLWRYYEWDNRVDNIITLINNEQPDVIAFQEVLTNHAYYDIPASSFIADQCGYPYRTFAPTLARHNTRDRDGNHNQLASEGQAFISKLPIVSSESYFLTYRDEYPEEKAVLFCDINVQGQAVQLCNVHLANSQTAYSQLDQLLELIEKRQSKTIILGDFNIYELADYAKDNSLLHNYVLSSELASYISYPEDNNSLDYIVAPTDTYSMSEIVCHENYVSDHRALSAQIDIRAT